MVLRVFLIASSIQLLLVLGVAPRQTQSNLQAPIRTKHSLADDKVTTDDSPAHHDQSSGIENVLKQLFPGRIMGGEVEKISADEFSKLFGSDKRKLQIQDENGKDTGIQYDFIPHVESETVPESATYTFFLRTGEPKLFLFDTNLDESKERNIKGSQTKKKNYPRKPKEQRSFEGDSGVELKEEHELKEDLISVNYSDFTQILKDKNSNIEEDRQSKIQNMRKLPIADISSLLDYSMEEEDENAVEIAEEFLMSKLDLTSISPIPTKSTGQTQLEDQKTTNITSKETTETGPNAVEVEEVSKLNKVLETLKTSKADLKINDEVDNINLDGVQETKVDNEAKGISVECKTEPCSEVNKPRVPETADKSKNEIISPSQEEVEMEEKEQNKSNTSFDVAANALELLIVSTADDNNSTFQLEMSNNTLNQEALNRNDELLADLVIDNLKRNFPNGTEESVKENELDTENRGGNWLKAIPFLAYWAVNYIRSDPRFAAADSDENEEERAKAISDNIERAREEFKEENNSGESDTSIYDVSEDLTDRNIINRNEVNGNGVNEKPTSLKDISIRNNTYVENVSINGIDFDRIIENNFSATKPNPCNCKHGGECIPASKSCYCSHGFTGIKCEKQIRNALVVGGLRDVQIRVDSELVGVVDDRRCSPPAFPTPIMAATGQTDRGTVVVCGGATQIGGRLTPTNRCHTWAKTDSWSPPVLMSSSRAWSASVLTPASQMVVFGGLDQNNVTLDSIEVIDIKTRKSILIGLTLPSPLAGHCAVQLNSSHTFLAGGAVTDLAGFGESPIFSNKAWILSEAGWTDAGDLVQARSVHSCSTIVTRGGEVEVLVVGGIGLSRVGTRMVLDSVEIYNVATGRWRKGDKLPYPVFGAGLLELAGQPLLIGGRYQVDDQLLQSDDIFTYQHSWRSSAPKMRSPRDQAVTVAAPAGC